MKDQFCSYEIALALKELGFDEECLWYWSLPVINGKWELNEYIIEDCFDYINAPLWQQAIDWFIKKGIDIEVRRNYPKDDYFFTIVSNTYQHTSGCYSRTEAREQAILKAIELCKKN